jgi:hypothetical protein
MMKATFIALVGGMLLVSGCANRMAWVREGTDAAQAQQDIERCKYEAHKNSFVPFGNGISPVSAGFQEGMQSASLTNQCMSAKGYHLVDRNELQQRHDVFGEFNLALENNEVDRALAMKRAYNSWKV